MIDDGDLDYAPDVLILPSRLKQFTKVDLCDRFEILTYTLLRLSIRQQQSTHPS